jgi:hypothetical protein
MRELFDAPKLVGVIADVHTGKSNLLYHIIETLRAKHDFNLITYGLKYKQGVEIFSLEELEQIKNSIIILDETFSLFDLDNRAKKKQIEQTLRLIHHNNNVLILSLLPENAKKFLASKFNLLIFKKCSIADFINGSMVKRVVQQYCGPEKGNTVLDIPIDKALMFDGKNYKMLDSPYYAQYDSKKNNAPILKQKGFFKKKG